MDLIRPEDQEDVFESVKARLEGGGDPRLRDRFTSPNVRYFPTSIHDESLYKVRRVNLASCSILTCRSHRHGRGSCVP